jgi:hypothetical protein
MSSTYTTEIEGEEGFTYVGDAIITNTKKIQGNQLSLQKQQRVDAERHQALLKLKNTLETFLNNKPSGIDQLPLKDQPHKLLELFFEQDNKVTVEQMARLEAMKQLLEIRQKEPKRPIDPDEKKMLDDSDAIQKQIKEKLLILLDFYNEEKNKPAELKLLEESDLIQLNTIMNVHNEYLEKINAEKTKMLQLMSGGKRKKTQHTVKKDKKLAKLYKKVKTMKYKKL